MIAVIDIGGTHIKYGVMDEEKETMTFLGKIDTNACVRNFSMIERISQVMTNILDVYPVMGIAISTTGMVNSLTGEIVYANKNIPNYSGTQLKEIMEKTFLVKCSVENDVNCALLGELNYGDMRTVQHALMLTIGTGVGGAVLINGEIFRGYSFSAGEMGYSLLNKVPIEDIISTTSLVKQVQVLYSTEKMDGYWIFEQAHLKNSEVINVLDSFSENLSQVIYNYICLLNPEVVILGGGIMEQKEFFYERLKQKFDSYPNQFVLQKTKLHFATLGNRSGLYGAYSHFKSIFNNDKNLYK